MTGVWMELCPACDAHRPAARAFIQWHRDPDRAPKALPKLFEDWETGTMHAHGWTRARSLNHHPAQRPTGVLFHADPADARAREVRQA
ncbi:DUF6300 family protein [Streptomyces sp. NPDC015242]|uniref:DUF6300 family protein n=1 Tax=Streptomyces sp. NPDC015242 TaxID=3364951 RepID=UPI0036FEC03A